MNESKPDPLHAVPPMPPSGRDVYVGQADNHPPQFEPHMAQRSANGSGRLFLVIAVIIFAGVLLGYWLA